MPDPERIIFQIAEHLDISPTDYARASSRFNAVSSWLNAGRYRSGKSPDVYLQGSFRLGTMVRPYRGDKDAAYDIDQVCELSRPAEPRSAAQLKKDVGDRLNEDPNYKRMLDAEGKRCWTLEYSAEDGRPGFHLDVLPAVPSSDGTHTQIDLTNKKNASYTWSVSNPRAYYQWFKAKNPLSDSFVARERSAIFEQNRDIYAGEDSVPKQLVRSSLQRAIQIAKRHRDVHFSTVTGRPASILITTIMAHQGGRSNIVDTISAFTNYVIGRHAELLRDGALANDGILYFDGKDWHVPSPVTFGRSSLVENFADRWNENVRLPAKFFEWVYALDRDISRFGRSGVSDDIPLKVKRFGKGDSYPTILRRAIDDGLERDRNETNRLLELIHLSIDGRVPWEVARNVAELLCRLRLSGDGHDVAKINYYQIAAHQRRQFSAGALADMRAIRAKYPHDAAFRMCCGLLLNEATRQDIAACLSSREATDVMRWPIIRLAKTTTLTPRGSREPIA